MRVVSMLSPRLQLKVAQKQILTPGLVQMVTVLQLNRMELKEMINQEIVENPGPRRIARRGRRDHARGIAAAARSRALLRSRRSVSARRRGYQTGRRFARSDAQYRRLCGGGSCRPTASSAMPPTPSKPPPPIPSTKSISARFSTIISIPATAARRRNRSKSPRSKPSFRSRRRCPIICARN